MHCVLAHCEQGVGPGDGQLKWPYGVCLLGDGLRIAVADYFNNRVCLFAVRGPAWFGGRD